MNQPKLRVTEQPRAVSPGMLSQLAPAKIHLEQLWRVLCSGYCLSTAQKLETFQQRLNKFPLEDRGIAFEGAAMGAAILDSKKPLASKRFVQLMQSDPSHLYVAQAHAGLGMALARLKQNPGEVINNAHPALRWSILNGYAFYQTYFEWTQNQAQKVLPVEIAATLSPELRETAVHVYTQGLGRSLWFLFAGDASAIAEAIYLFPQARQAALWTGIGVASTYAGGVDASELSALKNFASDQMVFLAQGAALAVRIRHRDSSFYSHTRNACGVFWNMEPGTLAEFAESAWREVTKTEPNPELVLSSWSHRIRQHYVGAQ